MAISDEPKPEGSVEATAETVRTTPTKGIGARLILIFEHKQ